MDTRKKSSPIKTKPIRAGDRFEDENNTVWQITEDRRFGRGYWVINIPGRTLQAIFHRATLERMKRAD